LFTFHKVTIPGFNDVFMGQCVAYRFLTEDGNPAMGLGLLDAIFENEDSGERCCSVRR
jgi:hypothetical protein